MDKTARYRGGSRRAEGRGIAPLAGGDTTELPLPSIGCAGIGTEESAVVHLGATALQPGGGFGHLQTPDSSGAKQM